MAIRYSGDVEIRVSYRDGRYHGSVRMPGWRSGPVTLTRKALGIHTDPRSSEAYDVAARALLAAARAAAKRRGKEIPAERDVSRVFRSPCPYVV